jgi:CubicO group peptidase (beta-lactamase class C family)
MSQPAINFAVAYLLSQVIEQVSGQSVFNFAYRYLFQPLGIATYAADDDDLPRDPMVGFQLKALDLVKIGYLLAQEGDWEDQRIVSKQWVRWLFFQTPNVEFDDIPGGSWVKTTIMGHESLVVRGDGGQYLVLVPALHVVLASGPPPLEYVHITKIRIENNRAYLRGFLKFDFRNTFAGHSGEWPLENLIKLHFG